MHRFSRHSVILRAALGVLLVASLVAVAGCSAPAATEPVFTEPESTYEDRSAANLFTLEATIVVSQMSDAFESVGNLLSTRDSSELAVDTPGRLMLDNSIAHIRAAQIAAEDLVPPASLKSAHEDLVEGITHYNDAMTLVLEGIDNDDQSKVDEATEVLKLGDAALRRSDDALREARGE